MILHGAEVTENNHELEDVSECVMIVFQRIFYIFLFPENRLPMDTAHRMIWYRMRLIRKEVGTDFFDMWNLIWVNVEEWAHHIILKIVEIHYPQTGKFQDSYPYRLDAFDF